MFSLAGADAAEALDPEKEVLGAVVPPVVVAVKRDGQTLPRLREDPVRRRRLPPPVWCSGRLCFAPLLGLADRLADRRRAGAARYGAAHGPRSSDGFPPQIPQPTGDQPERGPATKAGFD